MNYCPCCQDKLLCHISNNHVYWFCPSCWQAMPVCPLPNYHSFTEVISTKLAKMHQELEKSTLISDECATNSSKLTLV